jgi:ketosteroid isomerase-like protein
MADDDTRELVRRFLEHVERGDVEAAAALVAPDGELKSLFGQVEGGLYRGPDGVREWFRDVIEAFDDFEVGLRDFEDVGDAVIASGRARGRARASGIELEWEWALLARGAQGRLTRLAIYGDRGALARGEGLGDGASSAAGPS